MNISFLNNEKVVQEIKKEIQERISDNKDDQIESIIIWDTLKAVMRGKLISRTAHMHEMKRSNQVKLEEQLREQ
uniref:Uncharacterized protein n=1 Tax=Gouania willdenowi TaxID=441366 RepID=A0A8C5EXW9_GOUWI